MRTVVKQFEALVFSAFLLGGLAGCGPQEALGQSRQGLGHARWVIVHGASQGAWAWDQVVQKLQGEGETVTTLTLPAHDGLPPLPVNATFDSYIQTIGAAVHNGGSLPVHMIGHSLGGLLMSQYAELDPSSIQDLIYVSGEVPVDGDNALTFFDPDSYILPYAILDFENATINVPPEIVGSGFCQDCSKKELDALQARWRPEPIPPLSTTVHVTAANFGSVTKRYVYTLDDRVITYPYQQWMASRATFANTATIPSSHQVMNAHAGQLTDILLDLVR